MEMLKVNQGLITTHSGAFVRLRGFNIGGWLNLEDFINGFTGTEHNLRSAFRRILGEKKAQFFFDRLLDYFLTEQDVAYMAALGANVLRIPFNYRHFESDQHPYEYLPEGFRRLDQAIEWCGRHGIYAILDFHAVQGWQNPDWHADNAHLLVQLYSHQHFQQRAAALWREIARRYKDNPVVAGYGLMNEPCTRLEYERYDPSYYDWDGLNAVHRQMVAAIRDVDSDHILFIEGDNFATEYDGLDLSFDPQIVVETHNYETPTISPGQYPGFFDGMYWNRDILAAVLGAHSGVRLAYQQRKPVFVGEFGVLYTGRREDLPFRVAALDDQLSVFASAGAHWAIWTYKDVGAMGALTPHPECDYLKLIEPILKAKHLVADWEGEMPNAPAAQALKSTADTIDRELAGLGIGLNIERKRFAQFTLFGYLAQFLQTPYALLFKGKTETEIDHFLSAFAFKNCVLNQPLVDVLKKHFKAESPWQD